MLNVKCHRQDTPLLTIDSKIPLVELLVLGEFHGAVSKEDRSGWRQGQEKETQDAYSKLHGRYFLSARLWLVGTLLIYGEGKGGG